LAARTENAATIPLFARNMRRLMKI